MKRHEALVPLSHDHQHTLAIALRLTRADERTAAQAGAAFLAMWELEERRHLRVEEDVLLPLYAEHADPEHPLVRRLLTDHVLIRRDANLLLERIDLQTLHRLGARLAEHVHMEERELFPLVETTLPESALQKLHARLDQQLGAMA